MPGAPSPPRPMNSPLEPAPVDLLTRLRECESELASLREERALQTQRASASEVELTALREERAVQSAHIRASEERFRLLVENLDELVFMADPEGNLTFVSASIARFGLAAQDVIGQSYLRFVHPQDVATTRAKLRETLAGKRATAELRVLDGIGKTRFVRISARPVSDGDQVTGVQGVVTDLTHQRETEEQLRLAQKMEAVGRLAGGIAHDFNNLIMVIASYAELALDAAPPDAALRQDLQEIYKASARAAELTRQLLAFSRRQMLRPRLIDLNALVGGIERMLERLLGEDVQLEFVQGAGLGLTRADPGQIEQVLMNLAVNSRDAMPDGGKLTIRTANVVLDSDFASRHPGTSPGVFVKISVSDTGTGMDAATQARIFEPFFTTKGPGKGTGLGLAMAYGIVKQSGGSIRCESEVGIGTTFEIFLPREVSARAMEIRAAGATPRVTGRETILLVEDEEAVRNVTRRILVAAGYQVLAAPGGAEALKLWAEHKDQVSLLLTDVVMPGMSGRELADRLLAMSEDLKILYMSGYTDEAIVHRGVLDPGTNFIGKPFNTEALLGRVRSALDAPG